MYTDLRDFWGKSRVLSDETVTSYPLAFHNLDVAAVGLVLLRAGLPRVAPTLHPLLTTLLSWHDIGKFTRSFQSKVPALWPAALGRFDSVTAGYGHDTAGYAMMTGQLEDLGHALMPEWKSAQAAMLRAVCGHHGRPPGHDQVSLRDGCSACLDAARAFALAAQHLMGGAATAFPGKAAALRLTWQLAGLAVAADWIGSNEAWFATPLAPMTLAEHWTHAIRQAEVAVSRAGILPARARRVRLTELAAHADKPTPLQALAESLELAAGPSLVVIEDQTGAGKTEAALLLASRMMQTGQARGLFVALPTMATANAMYDRLAAAYRALFDRAAAPSLVLAHGRRDLHEGFQGSILPIADTDEPPAADPADETGEAQCAAWIASDRRRAFLADVGVGTVDQALLGVLPSRHAALRLLGLSQRVVIVDEAHAYDAYMAHELETLVAFLAGLGGSVVILSATLPKVTRTALVRAFHAGAGGTAGALTSDAYPLVTVASSAGAVEHPCAARAGLARTVLVERLATAEDAVARIAAAARAGLAVAWVRNAVDDAIEAVQALRAAGVAADLFHARFAMGDRLEIEAAAMQRFGRTSTPAERTGQVLVATQVVEQSLDLDFDLMVSDLAPVDLLIQRAGRLWRHRRDRPGAADAPRLLVVSPAAVADADGSWLRGALRRTRHIYRWTVLWQTARVLFAAGAIDTPGDVRRLVEAVYAPADECHLPSGLVAALSRETGQESAAISLAAMNVLRWRDAYSTGQGWDSDVRTPTRLSEPSVTFRMARWSNGLLTPWVSHASPRRAWALSEVSLAAWRAAKAPDPDGALAPAMVAVRDGWSRWERDTPILAMTPAGDHWTGCVADAKGRSRQVAYDGAIGLTFV